MKVRIIRQPTGTWDGTRLSEYVPEKVYEVSRSVGDFLVLQNYAVVARPSRAPLGKRKRTAGSSKK